MNKDFETINDILAFAIDSEQQAVDFYNQLAKEASTEDMRNVFTQFAQEEIGHKARLVKLKQEGSFSISPQAIKDLKIADYLTDVSPHPDMTYQEALIIAMKREKNAFKLYLDLAEKVTSQALKQIFMGLAQEESKHKLRFELEYDQHVLREN